jgi:hypothetical protein
MEEVLGLIPDHIRYYRLPLAGRGESGTPGPSLATHSPVLAAFRRNSKSVTVVRARRGDLIEVSISSSSVGCQARRFWEQVTGDQKIRIKERAGR